MKKWTIKLSNVYMDDLLCLWNKNLFKKCAVAAKLIPQVAVKCVFEYIRYRFELLLWYFVALLVWEGFKAWLGVQNLVEQSSISPASSCLNPLQNCCCLWLRRTILGGRKHGTRSVVLLEFQIFSFLISWVLEMVQINVNLNAIDLDWGL